jgi:hypothetical protein
MARPLTGFQPSCISYAHVNGLVVVVLIRSLLVLSGKEQ